MRLLLRSLLGLSLCLMPSHLLAVAQAGPIDYENLDFSIRLAALRAGNHDASGENEYYFVTTLFGLPVLKEEIKKPFAERQKTEHKQGEFAQLSIKNLKVWQPDKKPNPSFSLPVAGDTVREIVAETMRNFKVPEEQVAILCKIEMFERNKKLVLFGQDLKVGETSFHIIPESLPHKPLLQNAELQISDPLGTQVGLSVLFKTLDAPKKP